MTSLHLSGKWDTPAADFRRATLGLIEAHPPAYVTHTEARKHRAAISTIPEFGTVHPANKGNGEAECAIQYRLDGPALLSSRAVRLSAKPIPRRNGDLCFATYAQFADHHHLAIHLPSGVEGDGRLRDNAQATVYRSAIGGLRQFVATLDGPMVITGDWNLDLRKPWVRAYLAQHFPGFAHTPIPGRGTHGTRVIDFTLTRGYDHAAPTVLPNPASDHRALLERMKETPPMVMLTNLADVLRGAGLKVVEVDGWKTRGRPASSGGFDPVGVLCHHTATSKTSSDDNVVSLLVRGRSDLPGPLAQLGLARDGTVYVIAAGRANHAGRARASGTVAAGDGNLLYVGIEAFNDGRGEPWTAVQYDAYVKVCATLSLKVTGNSASTVRGHKETSVTGKVDPLFDMDKFRGAVAGAMTARVAAPVALPPTRMTRVRTELEAIAKAREVRHPFQARAIRSALKLLPRR